MTLDPRTFVPPGWLAQGQAGPSGVPVDVFTPEMHAWLATVKLGTAQFNGLPPLMKAWITAFHAAGSSTGTGTPPTERPPAAPKTGGVVPHLPGPLDGDSPNPYGHGHTPAMPYAPPAGSTHPTYMGPEVPARTAPPVANGGPGYPNVGGPAASGQASHPNVGNFDSGNYAAPPSHATRAGNAASTAQGVASLAGPPRRTRSGGGGGHRRHGHVKLAKRVAAEVGMALMRHGIS